MYHDDSCNIRIQGCDYAGFTRREGVQHGVLSASLLLFATCVDLLLMMLEHMLPGSICRAFADDIAFVTQDWTTQGPATVSILAGFQRTSNLGLNIGKLH